MKKITNLFFIVLFIFCCSKENDSQNQLSEHYEYNLFYKDAKTNGLNLKQFEIYFIDLDNSVAGFCIFDLGIYLNQNLWANYGPYQRLQLMYHELGHCVMGLDHGNGIMSPSILSEEEIKTNWQSWVLDLFLNSGDIKKLKNKNGYIF